MGTPWGPYERFSDRLDDPPAPVGPPAAEHDRPPAAERDCLPLARSRQRQPTPRQVDPTTGRPHDSLTPRRIPPPVLATFLLQNPPQSI